MLDDHHVLLMDAANRFLVGQWMVISDAMLVVFTNWPPVRKLMGAALPAKPIGHARMVGGSITYGCLLISHMCCFANVSHTCSLLFIYVYCVSCLLELFFKHVWSAFNKRVWFLLTIIGACHLYIFLLSSDSS